MPNLQTRIKLKYDTLEHWQLVADTFKPLPGEVCICEVPTGGSLEQTTPPATLCKVGDGVNTWANLPWMSALAADVYPWAKSPTPPEVEIPDVTIVPGNTSQYITNLSANGHTITINRADKSNTFSAATGNVITGVTIGPDGVINGITQAVDKDTPDTNTTYTLDSTTAGTLTFTPSDGEPEEIPIEGWDTIATAQQCASAAYTLAQAANTLATSANALATTANNTASTAVQTATNSGTGVVLSIAKSGTTITATRGLVNESLVSTTVNANLTAASTALQPSDITTGTANGAISVDGADVQVKGLGSAAYTASTAYEAAGAVNNHNTSGTAHADIRSLITGLTEKVNGRTTAYVYQNKADPDYTGAIAKAGSFIIGDTIYFLDSEIPDEWVTAVNDASPFYTFQEIETESPSFDGYVTGTNLTADKIVLGNADSAVKASVYGIVTTLTDSDNSNVATSKAVADYIASLGHITKTTADDTYAPIATKNTVDSIMNGATVVPTANNYAAGGNIATTFATKFDTVTPSGTAGVVTAVTDGGGTTISVTQTSLATADPTASGSATTFIDTISQAANGKITATKKSVTFPAQITPGNGALQDGTGNVIFTANQSTNTQILVIDCGTASTVVYNVPEET